MIYDVIQQSNLLRVWLPHPQPLSDIPDNLPEIRPTAVMFQCVHKQAFGICWSNSLGGLGGSLKEMRSLRRGLFETRSLWGWSQSLTSVLLPAEYLLLVCITQTQNLVSCLASVWLKWHKHDGFTATDQRKLVSVSKIPDSVKTPQTSTSELPAGSQHHWHWCSVSWSLKSTFHSASWFLLCLRIKRNT